METEPLACRHLQMFGCKPRKKNGQKPFDQREPEKADCCLNLVSGVFAGHTNLCFSIDISNI